MNIQIDQLVEKLIIKTKDNKLAWKKVIKNRLHKLIDRSLGEGEVQSAYYVEDNESEVVAVGKIVKPHWVGEDQYVLDDYYFITLTDSTFDDPLTFFESDHEINNSNFPYDLARLYRLIRLNYTNAEGKINKWLK